MTAHGVPALTLLHMSLFRNLKAWKHAKELAVECSKAARDFPECEQRALAEQLRRACYSVPINIAEASTRRGTRLYRQCLDTACVSLSELETILEMARDLEYIELTSFARLEARTIETSKTLYGLRRKASASSAK